MTKISLWTRFTNLFSKKVDKLEPMAVVKITSKGTTTVYTQPKVEPTLAEILNTWPRGIDDRHRAVKGLGETAGWTFTKYRFEQKQMMFEFKKLNKTHKINVYLSKMTVSENVTGRRQVIKKNVEPKVLRELFITLKRF